jgi:arsenate reductase
MKILHNPRCRKSRETLQILKDNQINPEIIEYLKNPPSKNELKDVLSLLGKSPNEIIRKGEKEFKENFKGKEMTDDEWIDAMLKFPKLIERPIVISEKRAVIGRPPENVKKLF